MDYEYAFAIDRLDSFVRRSSRSISQGSAAMPQP